MARSTRAQKVERLNAAYTLLAQGMTASDVVVRLSQRFGLSRRQSYRYVQDACAMDQPAEPTEALIPIIGAACPGYQDSRPVLSTRVRHGPAGAKP